MLSITLTMLAFSLLPLTARAAAVLFLLFQERESCAGDPSRDGTCALSIRGGFQYCRRGSRDAGEKQETASVV